MTISRHLEQTNVSSPERWVSVVAGTALAAYGITRRNPLGLALAGLGGGLVWRGATGHCDVYHALGVSTARDDGSQVSVPYGKGVRVEQSITINASPEALYGFWRDLDNLPRFMSHLRSVEVVSESRSHWVADGPVGTRASWEAEIINEVPGELIGWRSVDGSSIRNAGSVHFERNAMGGTNVRVILRYDPPAGRVGAAFARVFGDDPDKQIAEDLHRLRDIIEKGDVADMAGIQRGEA